MTNNNLLCSLRHMLDVSDAKIVEIMKLEGGQATLGEVIAYLWHGADSGYQDCPQNLMDRFLNGLIYFKRGIDESRPTPPPELPTNKPCLKTSRRIFFERRRDRDPKIGRIRNH